MKFVTKISSKPAGADLPTKIVLKLPKQEQLAVFRYWIDRHERQKLNVHLNVFVHPKP